MNISLDLCRLNLFTISIRFLKSQRANGVAISSSLSKHMPGFYLHVQPIVYYEYIIMYTCTTGTLAHPNSHLVHTACVLCSDHQISYLEISDNGPQYASEEFTRFAVEYSFIHITRMPHFPQRNGHAECCVQTVKNLLVKSQDPYLAILMYRSTPPPWYSLSPAEPLIGRRVRTNLPLVLEQLKPNWPYVKTFYTQDCGFKHGQKSDLTDTMVCIPSH